MKILAEIRQALRDSADEKTLASSNHFFKEEVKVYGVKVPHVNQIAKLAFAKIKHLPKQEIFEVCDELWRSGYSEEGYIASNISYAMRKHYEPADFAIFERWVHDHISNWATCDTLCNHTVGEFVTMYPEYIAELKKWAHSDNRWVRRAAAVTLIIPARKGLFLDDILEIAHTLLMDKDDMVQKGYGWMLKAASMSESFVKGTPETKHEHLTAIFDFVIQHRAVMPRTALRYAIEKMPPDLKAKAMKINKN
jgi:3-methyladenine DNA glycosylase AlkD